MLEPIQRLFSGRKLSDEDLVAVRDAVATIVHEAAHLSSRHGDPDLPGAHPPRDAAGEALDEGLTERWTHDNLDDILQDVGIDRQVPEVLDARTKNSYPAYVAAVQRLSNRLAEITSEPSEEIPERIRAADLSQRWNAIAGIVIDRDLAGLMPQEDRPVIRESLTNGLRGDFARAQRIHDDRSLSDEAKELLGRQVGEAAANNLDVEVSRLQDGYRNRQSLAGRSPTPSQPGIEQSDPGMDHLRRMMSGSAPAAQAPRTDPNEAARASYRASGLRRGPSTRGRS